MAKMRAGERDKEKDPVARRVFDAVDKPCSQRREAGGGGRSADETTRAWNLRSRVILEPEGASWPVRL